MYTLHLPGLSVTVSPVSGPQFDPTSVLESILVGSPYSIARIIEFLPPTAAKYNHNVNKGPSKERHVRIALFYRPSEVSITKPLAS
jgi:hypothetical protein